MGYVYLLLEVDKDGNERHKIGITKNDPNKRKSQLQTGNPNKISVLTHYESDNYKRVELWLHKKLSSFKTEADNEWFTLNDDQVSGFQIMCQEADKIITMLKETNPFCK